LTQTKKFPNQQIDPKRVYFWVNFVPSVVPHLKVLMSLNKMADDGWTLIEQDWHVFLEAKVIKG
jgi:hypothetical protein